MRRAVAGGAGAAAVAKRAAVSEEGQGTGPTMPSAEIVKGEGAVPPMPSGAFVKEEEVAPPMPPGAYFKEEDAVQPLSMADAVVKQEPEVVVNKEEKRLDGRPKRQRI